jgi:hypothetical protein
MRFCRLLFIILVPVVFVLVPTSYFLHGPTLCLVKNLFGIECPGCGMTRALSALVHADFITAVKFNRAVVIVGPLLGYILLRAVFTELFYFIRGTSSPGNMSQ